MAPMQGELRFAFVVFGLRRFSKGSLFMFDFVRSHTRLFLGLLVLLIIPSFVFFGVQGYSSMRDSAAANVATVDGQSIKQAEWDAAHRQQIDRVRQQMPNVDMKLLDTPQIRRQTLDGLVRDRVLAAVVFRDHLQVSDERLVRLFQTDPQYAPFRKPDGSVNKELLAAQGLSSEYFAQQLRQDYAVRQVLEAVMQSQVSGDVAARTAVDALLQQRQAQWEIYSAKDFLARVNPSEADIKAYYDAHTSQFRSVEEADIEYVQLDLEALKRQINVPEADLRKYYDENISRYTAAEERRAAHILIAADKSAPAEERAKAKAKAESVLAEVRKSPEMFAALAKKYSADPGSAERGGDLDFFGRGAMTKPFEDAVFAMKVGEISPLVESEFGFHIIRLTATRGGDRKPFEAVRATILDEVGKQLAQSRYAADAEQFTNMVYEQSDSLQAVVDKLKLSLQKATVRRQAQAGATGPLASVKLLEAVFGNEALKNKRNTEAVEVGPNQMVSARVVSYRPERVLALDEVKPRVLEAVRQQQAVAMAAAQAKGRVEALGKQADLSLAQSGVVSRAQAAGLPREALDAVLKADLAKGSAVMDVSLGDQGHAVVKVLKVVPREAADPQWLQARPAVAQALATAESEAYLASLKRRFKAEIHPPKSSLEKSEAGG